MAISGRLVVIASRIRPPSASPSPNRLDRTSVVSESLIPAYQTATAAAPKMDTRASNESEANMGAPDGPPEQEKGRLLLNIPGAKPHQLFRRAAKERLIDGIP